MIVAARLRPLLPAELASCLPQGVFPRPGMPGVLDVHELRRPVKGLAQLQSSDFRVDHTFGPDASTDRIYNEVVQSLLPWAWNGGIGTLFAYGQTGSGKTYTISRLEQLVANELMSGRLEGDRVVNVTIIELVGKNAYDLLNDRHPISILEDAFGVIQLTGALENRVSTAEGMLNLIERATALRRTEATDMNEASSRSHAICRIRIQKHSAINYDEDGMLYLIDLAGSEAGRDTVNHNRQRMSETRDINASLSVLKDCIRIKGEADTVDTNSRLGETSTSKRKPHVPFRQTFLTKILKHVFDPAALRHCKTVVIACVNPCFLDTSASKNTLRYAEALRVILPKVGETKYNAKIPRTWNNEQLKEWIQDNSGSPPVDASLLAPFETGIQLLRLTPDEFQSRCVKTRGVSIEKAMEFYLKIWQMHIDSQRTQRQLPNLAATSISRTNGDSGAIRKAPVQLSSLSLDHGAASIPFKQ
ncbi:Diatom spindle kinesin-1 [Ceratocystis fimbriata CBS 114723]|uniref:Kinesin-like protein n=1 Tax=Ceratocystis fimbriata CBS 114723 TaxID=1035309 RepID=A0A2C5WQH3_9PEZI|nr:Diatom spindle kinesin-1 [Ceratocystis fimbriata CBS 114723]